MYFKDFDKWNHLKKQINKKSDDALIRVGEIRWVVLGINVGSEIDGKGQSFSRPVLIIHVIKDRLALIAPLSTKIKTAVGYIPFEWHNSKNILCLNQIKIISQKRILGRKGRIPIKRLKAIKKAIIQFYSL